MLKVTSVIMCYYNCFDKRAVAFRGRFQSSTLRWLFRRSSRLSCPFSDNYVKRSSLFREQAAGYMKHAQLGSFHDDPTPYKQMHVLSVGRRIVSNAIFSF